MPSLNPKDYEIAWIAPLPIEAKAALEMLDERHTGRFAMGRGDDYVFVPGKMCGLNIIIVTLPAGKEYGTESAAALASQVKKIFTHIWFGLLVGVAAGLPSPSSQSRPNGRDIRLGDVLVALPDGNTDGVIAYQLGKQTQEGFNLLRDGHVLASTADAVRSIIGRIKLEEPDESRLFLPYYETMKCKKHSDGDFLDPGQENDVLHETDEAGVEKVVPRTSRPNAERTRVWYGPIGSGDTLMKYGMTRNEFRDTFNIIGLEMEAAGTMNIIPVGVIRGVCDYGDSHKNKEWQPYAAAMAAAYAKAVLAEVGRDEASDSDQLAQDANDCLLPRYPKDLSFRVQNIPSGETQESLKNLLSHTEPSLGPYEKIRVLSLARDSFSCDSTKTATIMLEGDELPLWLKKGNAWTIKTRDGRHTIQLDTHFLGFTTLNDVHKDNHVLDCVFIHGLNGHPLCSWADTKYAHFTWVRDKLPTDANGARAVLYGYDTQIIDNKSVQSIEDVARTLVDQLQTMDQTRGSKAVIFLAHSLGGIVLKSALRILARHNDVFLRYVREIMFFGVPNQGMETSHFMPMIRGQPNHNFVTQLARGSAYLENLDQQVAGLAAYMNPQSSQPVRLISFYETCQSGTAEYNSLTRQWENSGPQAILVNASFAIQSGSTDQDRHPIDDTHSNMIKFSPGSSVYEVIRQHVVEQIQVATLNSLNRSASSEHIPRLGHNLTPEFDDDPGVLNEVAHSLNVWNIEVRHRFESLQLPYQNTFNWIWQNDSPLLHWLKTADPIFWVSGKPGSGKSMLMKYISHTYEKKMGRLFPDDSNPSICVSFSFYDPGTELQKSIEGLLYAILSQCINSEPALGKCIVPVHSKCKGQWSIEHLREALDMILSQNQIAMRIVLFLDALDECKEPANFVVDFLNHMIDLSHDPVTQIRICLSSRPYNTFLDAYGSFPGLRIQDYTKNDVLTYINGRFGDNRRMSLLLARDCEAKPPVGPELIQSLRDRAEGVFLWLRLTIDELLEECRDGAEDISDLLDKLQSLSPEQELEDKYKRILQKVPQKFRLDAYVMLEMALRSDEPMNSYDFWLAISCAKQDSLASCISEIPSKPWIPWTSIDAYMLRDESELSPGIEIGNLYGMGLELIPPADTQDRRLSSRCGGLLERRRTVHGGGACDSIEFMHRTVKEFVQKFGLSDLLGDQAFYFNQNGYSFLSKYGLAQLAVERRRWLTPLYKSIPHFCPLLPKWFSYLHYFSRAEASTGFNQKHLLDEAEAEDAFAPARDEDDVYGLYGSALTFGAVTSLLNYVEASLKNDEPAFVKEMLGLQKSNNSTLLHDVVRRTLDRENYIPKRLFTKRGRPLRRIRYYADNKEVSFDDITQMAALLLRLKASLDSIHRNHTPFQLLCRASYEGYGGGDNSIPQPILSMAQLFLNNGQDPDCDVPARNPLSGVADGVCKPLHLADPPLASMLLGKGASVNALDNTGLTPLDVAFGAKGNIFEIGDHTRPKDAYQLVLLLLRYGGCVTSAGLASLPNFHTALGRYKGMAIKDLDPRISNPPHLG